MISLVISQQHPISLCQSFHTPCPLKGIPVWVVRMDLSSSIVAQLSPENHIVRGNSSYLNIWIIKPKTI